MGSSRFGLLLTLRLSLVFGGLFSTGILLAQPGYHAATLLAAVVTVLLAGEVYGFVSRTNRELARFLDAVRYADFGQRFQSGPLGAGFETLGETFTELLERFRTERAEQEAQLRQLKALLEHVPVPLLSIEADERVVVWNNAARRLLGTIVVRRVEDLSVFGEEFVLQLRHMRAGERRLAGFEVDGVVQRVALSASELTIGGRVERLVSVLDIQSELDGTQQRAWQDLVRVLTHEIMNSITPVSSLARTAVDTVEDARGRVDDAAVRAELDDARDAVATVARRSEGLTDFVERYRKLARPPEPAARRLRVRELFEEVQRVVAAQAPETVVLELRIEPAELELHADFELIVQVLINLVRNAFQALAGRGGRVVMSARLSPRGRVVVEVTDDGPGVAEDIRERIFVPFFTTRRDGSGVGLALSRQIMVAHGGTLSLGDAAEGGAQFSLVF